MAELGFLAIGVAAGVLGGLLGIGGGTVVVPSLVFFYHFSQHKAQGTILAAILAPVFILAVNKYYQSGNVDVRAAIFIAIGILVGGLFGAKLSLSIPEVHLKRLFGVFLLFIATQLILSK